MKQNGPGVKYPAGKYIYILSLGMVVVYVAMGYMIAFSQLFKENMQPAFRYIIGVLFIIYGLFRAYRVYKKGK